jgi:hypothetical protein
MQERRHRVRHSRVNRRRRVVIQIDHTCGLV